MSKKIRLSRDEQYTVKIEDLGSGGKGIAKIEGKVVFVEKAVPGQEVKIRPFKDKKDFAEARVEEIITESDRAVAPECPHFFYCGGCAIQNISYDEQIKYKRQWLIDALERIGGLKGIRVRDTVASPDSKYYRNKMEFSFGSKVWNNLERRIENDSFGLGMHLPGRYDTVINVTGCILQSEMSTKIVNLVREFAIETGKPAYNIQKHSGFWRYLIVREGKKTGESLVLIITNACTDDDRKMIDMLSKQIEELHGPGITVLYAEHPGKSQAAVWESIRTITGKGYIEDGIGDRKFRIESQTFFQVNTRQVENLYGLIKDASNFKGNEVVYDLFTGVGTIPVFLADHAKSFLGIEVVESSVKSAKENAKYNNVTNCDFIQGKVRAAIKYPPELNKKYGRPDVVITDPPRSGMDPKTVERIVKLGPQRIVYVSCNPATLSRDLAGMTEHYDILEVVPVDMFPHTAHLESVTILTKKEQPGE